MKMFERYVNSKFYLFFDILYTIILVNLLWLLTSFLGVVVFTLMPATVAVYLIILNVRKDLELKPMRTFLIIFKREYIKSQKVFLMLFVVGFIIGLNITFYAINLETLTSLHLIGLVIMLLLGTVYLSTLVHVIPVYIYFPHLTPYKIIKNAMLLGFAYPFKTFLAMASAGIIIFLSITIQPVLPFLLMSLIALLTLSIVKKKYEYLLKEGHPLNIKDYIPE